MSEDGGPAECEQVIDGGMQTNCVCDAGRASFEFCGRVAVGCFLKGDTANHISATLPRRHDLLQLLSCIECANTCGSEEFVSGEDEEVAADGLHIDGHVGDGLVPSISTSAPCRLAAAVICSTGRMVPRLFDACVSETSFVRLLSRDS